MKAKSYEICVYKLDGSLEQTCKGSYPTRALCWAFVEGFLTAKGDKDYYSDSTEIGGVVVCEVWPER
jgi:hypothetical protein